MKKNLPTANQRALERETAPIKLPAEVLSALDTSLPPEKDARAYIADPIHTEPFLARTVGGDPDTQDSVQSETGERAGSSAPIQEINILKEVVQKQQETTELANSAYDKQKKRIQDRKYKRRMGAVKRYGLLLSVIALLLILIYFLPPFHVQRFQVDGISNLSESEVIEASGIEMGKHLLAGWGGGIGRILGVRNGAAEDKIKQTFPYVNDVRVGPKFPGIVHITVQERVPVTYVDYQGQIVLLDKDGIVLDIIRNLHKEIPIIHNVKLENPVPGATVSDEVKKTLRPAILVLDALINNDNQAADEFSFFSQVKTITLTDGPETYLTLSQAYAQPGTRVMLGDRQTLGESINWLRYAARTDSLLNLGEGTLDLTGTKKYFYSNRNKN